MNLRMINTEPEPEPDTRTDAQIAADWAREALADGRYELGAALANIARQAARVEARGHAARMVPMLGRTRDEQPAPVSTVPAHLYDEIERSGAIPRVDEQGARFPVDYGQRMQDDPAETEVVAMGPTGNGDRDRDVPELAREAQTELFGAVREPESPAPVPSGRCLAVVEHDGPAGTGNTGQCWEVIFWEPGRIGDEQGPPIPAGWRHLNPETDQHHAPVPQQG